MAKGKSKEFLLKSRIRFGKDVLDLCYLNGKGVETFGGDIGDINGICAKAFASFFGISIKPNKKKRIRITIEEI